MKPAQRLHARLRGPCPAIKAKAASMQPLGTIKNKKGHHLNTPPLWKESRAQHCQAKRYSWAMENNITEEELLAAYAAGERNFSGANLSGANLGGANLNGASLMDANLSRAVLVEAVLSAANLSRANLSRAILSGANLSGANLSGADIRGAKLNGADLRGANLDGAIR